jgi:tRNA(fMet)-specific endonuclease VapC
VIRRYLLDTNIVSDLVRHPQGPITEKIETVGEDRVCTSLIVAAELRYGAAKRDSKRLTVQLDTVLAALDVLPLEPPIDRIYGDLRAQLEKRGCLIGPNDLLIASQALALDCILVTDNEREFRRVDELTIENWRRD